MRGSQPLVVRERVEKGDALLRGTLEIKEPDAVFNIPLGKFLIGDRVYVLAQKPKCPVTRVNLLARHNA